MKPQNMTMGQKTTEKSRRGFLKKLTIFSIVGAFALQAWYYIQFLFPQGLTNKRLRQKIGRPDDFRDGITFLDTLRIFIVKDDHEFYALSAVCTHLGCTVKKTQSHNHNQNGENFEFDCPCHGSRFDENGKRIAGPARKPLPRYALFVAKDDGQLIVDLNEEVDNRFRLRI